MEVTHGRVIDSLADNALRRDRRRKRRRRRRRRKATSRATHFLLPLPPPFSPLTLTVASSFFLSLSRSRERRDYERTRAAIGGRLSVSVSLHTASVFFPRTRCVSFSVFRSGSLRRTLLSLSLSSPPSHSFCSLALVYGRAGGRTVRHFLIRVSVVRASEWLSSSPLELANSMRLVEARRHALVKFRGSAEPPHAPLTASLGRIVTERRG